MEAADCSESGMRAAVPGHYRERLAEGDAVPDLLLSEREQAALRTLTGAEPIPGEVLPSVDVLECISRLIPADDVMVCLTDATGWGPRPTATRARRCTRPPGCR